jgi:hypothetical protein
VVTWCRGSEPWSDAYRVFLLIGLSAIAVPDLPLWAAAGVLLAAAPALLVPSSREGTP